MFTDLVLALDIFMQVSVILVGLASCLSCCSGGGGWERNIDIIMMCYILG